MAIEGQSEEQKVVEAASNDNFRMKAFRRIPYPLINQELGERATSVRTELNEICTFYKAYKYGMAFTVEGSNGDYVPAMLRYRMAASLIDKEARFLFAEAPEITIEAKGDVGKVTQEAKDQLTTWNDLLKTILDANKFEKILIQAAKDCFIGKRVAALVNFNEEDGVTLTFLPPTQFLFETKLGNPNVLVKFVCFQTIGESYDLMHRRIFKKKYTLEADGVYLEERMFDGSGLEVSTDEFEPTEKQITKLKTIPAVIFLNDGLTGDDDGESDIESLCDYESWYSKLNNADIDAGRKSMNPTKYTVDMDSRSTRNLSSGAGAFWDLMSDQNLDHSSPKVGLLEPSMNYSNSLKMTLDRIKTTGYEQVDVPNVTLETLQGSITTGKALKAIYWSLIVRCKEKMKMWGPQLTAVVDIIVEGALAYPNCVTKYTDEKIVPVAYKVRVKQNTPLPEDEIEERTMDLSEVAAQTMSKKAYMKKWRGLTDDEVREELEQMAIEREMLEDSVLPMPEGNEDIPEDTVVDETGSNTDVDNEM